MAEQLKDLKLTQVQQVNKIRVEEVYALCECPGHLVTAYPAFPIVKDAYHSNQTEDPVDLVNGGSWTQVQQEKGRFPSQPQVNTAGTHFIGNSSGLSNLNPSLEEAKAITTLRSGNPVAEQVVSPDLGSVPEEEDESESPEVEVSAPAAPTLSPPVAPYSHRLVAKPKANVLKDLCTSKWRTKSQDKVLLTEQVSSILQADIPTKCKDPGCPTIPIAIVGQQFDKALLDLGASVNLLPYSVYLQLGLGDLRTAPVTLQLADRSVRVPKGVVDDVLIQVGEFLLTVDFTVLDTCPILEVFEKTPIILGHPFLATSNAVMNCTTGQV
ncbi:uncharacterized protein LOC131323871 [Rhododendron vialii]|uniref:uncharacterized protein LOC131323871 n=1 Tax=Rhododendron vialii TaxID=182163 RepID=UPI00265F770A|nr:uncharacterized protein LOC131323871 [Rhododendron vialii]